MANVINLPTPSTTAHSQAGNERSEPIARAPRPLNQSDARPSGRRAEHRSIQTALNALYGSGNPQLNDSQIRQYITTPGRTGARVTQAAIENDVNVEQYLTDQGLGKNILITQDVASWGRPDVDQALASLSENNQKLIEAQQDLDTRLRGLSLLDAEAQQAQNVATQRRGELDALNVQVGRGKAEYQWLIDERDAAQALKQQAQADFAAGQQALAHVGEVKKKHDRRATASINAQHRIDAAQQRLSQTQRRLDKAEQAIAALEAWGLPLIEQQARAQAAWEQAADIAQEKTEIADTQLERVSAQAARRNALIAQISLDHDQLVTALAARPHLELAEEIHASVQETHQALAQALDRQRAWTDSLLAQGSTLQENARTLEAQANASIKTRRLKDLMLARASAEAQLVQAKQAFDTAKTSVQSAQEKLDAAYQARMQANDLDSKGNRARGRDEADRRKRLAADELAQAQQRFQEAQRALEMVQSAALPTINAALQAQAQWQTLSTQAQNASAQVNRQVGLAAVASNLESALQSAAAQTQVQQVDVAQAKVLAAQTLSEHSPEGNAAIEAIEKSIRLDLEAAIATLHSSEQIATNDRMAAQAAQAQSVQFQTTALGQARIAEHLANEAQALHDAAATFDLAKHQNELTQTRQRLAEATLRREMADMHMDWAEGRTHTKKQARDIEAASGERTAAEKEWLEAQQAYAQAQAQLTSAQIMRDPLQSAAEAANADLLIALQNTERSAAHANTAAAWADTQQTRDQGSDTLLQIAELSVVEGTRALASLQSTLALTQTHETTAARIGEEGALTQSWAADYAQQLAQTQQTRQTSRAAQRQLNKARLEADAEAMFQTFLTEYAEQISQATQQPKQNTIADLETRFSSAAEQARIDAGHAIEAHERWAYQEGRAGLAFIQNKLEPFTPEDFIDEADLVLNQRLADGAAIDPTPQTRWTIAQTLAQQANDARNQQMQNKPQAVVDAWLSDELQKRKKSTRKQLQLLDDIEQWKNQDPQRQAAQDEAQRSARQAQTSSEQAAWAGLNIQAHRLLALTQTQQLEQTQALLTASGERSARLSAQLATDAQMLARQFSAEREASAALLGSLAQFLQDAGAQTQRLRSAASAVDKNDAPMLVAQADGLAQLAQTHESLAQNAQVIQNELSYLASQADTQALIHREQAAQHQRTAQALSASFNEIKAQLESNKTSLLESAQQQEDAAGEFYRNVNLARTAVQNHDARETRAADIHERRLRADRVHKKRKKKSLFSILVQGAAALATAALTYFAPPLGLTLGEQLLATAAVGSALNAGAQGVNLAAGFQDQFDVKPMIAMGGMAAFGTMMGTVTSALDQAFQGTLLGSEVPGSAATQTLISSSNPLSQEVSMAVATQAAAPAIEAGALDWLGTAISWGTGATAGSLARQGLMIATGQQSSIRWDHVHLDAVKQAIGGFLRIHVGSSFASNPFTFTHYRAMSLGDMAMDVAKRVAGTFATNVLLKNAGMIDDIRISDLVAVGVARAAQVVLRDAMGTLPIAGNPEPGALVASPLGQSIIRTTTVLTRAAIEAAYGESIDWNKLLDLGVGRVAGQLGTRLGQAQAQNALDHIRA